MRLLSDTDMKKLQLRFLNRINVILGALIALCGVGCKHQKATVTENPTAQDENTPAAAPVQDTREREIVCKYGVPRAEIRVSGVVKDASGKPVSGAQVLIEGVGAAQTDEEGKYTIHRDAFPIDTLTITVSDQDGKFEEKTTVVPAEYEGYIDTWNQGTATKVVDFELTPVNFERIKKYGVPYRERVERTEDERK